MLDEGEDIEVLLVSREEVKQLIRGNKFMQSMHVTALLYALEKLGSSAINQYLPAHAPASFLQ